MTLAERFAAAVQTTRAAEALLPDRLASACVAVAPVDGAGISVTFSADRRIPVGSSDHDSRAAERLQYTLGEGPCLSARRWRRTVRATAQDLQTGWPVYWMELTSRTPFRSVAALPVPGVLGGFATLELYCRAPDAARTLPAELVDELATTVGAHLAAALADPEQAQQGTTAWLRAPDTRAAVWQAVGLLAAEHDSDTAAALAVLRSTAFTTGVDLERAAADVLLDHHIDHEDLADPRPTHVGAGPGDGPPGGDALSCEVRHRMHLHPGAPGVDTARPVQSSWVRGPHQGHCLTCGGCEAVVARDWMPSTLPQRTPLLRCARCGSINDPTDADGTR